MSARYSTAASAVVVARTISRTLHVLSARGCPWNIVIPLPGTFVPLVISLFELFLIGDRVDRYNLAQANEVSLRIQALQSSPASTSKEADPRFPHFHSECCDPL